MFDLLSIKHDSVLVLLCMCALSSPPTTDFERVPRINRAGDKDKPSTPACTQAIIVKNGRGKSRREKFWVFTVSRLRETLFLPAAVLCHPKPSVRFNLLIKAAERDCTIHITIRSFGVHCRKIYRPMSFFVTSIIIIVLFLLIFKNEIFDLENWMVEKNSYDFMRILNCILMHLF